MFRMQRLKLALLVLTGSCVSAALCAAEPDSKWYPKTQGEMKAILTVMEPTGDASMKELYIQRLKMYRYVVGVPYEDIVWDDGQAKLAHYASLVCSKLNKLTHTPSKPNGMSDADYKLGKQGAGQSNLFQGRTHPSRCVDGWMDDSDPSNIDRVGHRRWCINPYMLKSGFGTVGRFAAMYAFDRSRKNTPDWDYVAYPARGYQPMDLFGNRHAWSVSVNPRKYAKPSKKEIKATIQPVDANLEKMGGPLKHNYFNVETSGFGSGPAIIFRPDAFSMEANARYKVTITGLKTKKKQPTKIEYLVHFVHIQDAPDSPNSRAIMTKHLRKRLDAALAIKDRPEKLERLIAFSEDRLLPSAEPALAKEAKDTIAEMLKDPKLQKERDADRRYKMVVAMEKKAGNRKRALIEVARVYRDFARVFKGTRAGTRAAADFERLKNGLQ